MIITKFNKNLPPTRHMSTFCVGNMMGAYNYLYFTAGELRFIDTNLILLIFIFLPIPQRQSLDPDGLAGTLCLHHYGISILQCVNPEGSRKAPSCGVISSRMC